MFITDIKNSAKDSVIRFAKNVKGQLSAAFNSRAITAARALIDGGAVGYKAITLAAGIGLLATASLPVTTAIVVGVAALTAFVTINDYKKLRDGQRQLLGAQVNGMERGLGSALKMAKRFRVVAATFPTLA